MCSFLLNKFGMSRSQFVFRIKRPERDLVISFPVLINKKKTHFLVAYFIRIF